MENKMNILNNFVYKVKNILGSSFEKAILYGSYARGDYNENSDMDVMILTSLSDQEIVKIENSIYDLAYESMLSDNLTISVNIKNLEHFNYWLGALPYYDNINKEGLVLAGW